MLRDKIWINMKNYLKLLKFLEGNVKILVLASACMLFSALFDGFQLSLIVPITDKILSKSAIVLPGQVSRKLRCGRRSRVR